MRILASMVTKLSDGMSLVAVTLAMLVGFGWVLLVGAGMYGLAAGVAYVVRR